MSELKDFDQAWSEKEDEGYPFKVKGAEYELPPSVPAQAMLDALRLGEEYEADEPVPPNEAIKLARKIIGEDQVQAMLDDGVTVDELTDVIEWANSVYSPEAEEDGSGKVN